MLSVPGIGRSGLYKCSTGNLREKKIENRYSNTNINIKLIDLLAMNLINMIFLFKKIDAFEMRQQYVAIQHEIILN